MSVQRSSIVAVGLVILTECVAFGGGKDQVAAPVAQRTVVRRDRELPDPIGSPGATTIARESGAVSHPDLHSSVCRTPSV
jgi:hypothetical protein